MKETKHYGDDFNKFTPSLTPKPHLTVVTSDANKLDEELIEEFGDLDEDEDECEHLHWENDSPDEVSCLDCGEKGGIIWDTDVKKAIADRLRGLS